MKNGSKKKRQKRKQRSDTMKRLFVIGNGFDLHHNLQTGYNDFKKYLKLEEPEYFNFINNLMLKNNPDFDSNDWSEIETELICVMSIDYDGLLNEAIESSEKDMDRASYWNDIQFNAEYLNQDLPNFKKSFDEWIDTIDFSRAFVDENLVFTRDDHFLNFNYTKTLQILYGIKESQVLHIHGENGTDKVFGQSEYYEDPLPLSNLTQEDYDNGIEDDWRIEEAKGILNSIPKTFYKDCEAIIEENRTFFDSLCEFDEIVFMGWKLGPQDIPYIEEILKNISKQSKIRIVYYKDDMETCDFYDYHLHKASVSKRKVSYYTWEQVNLIFE